MPLFALTMFVSAALLFVVQPMFTKMVLPLLGGSAAVWNSCLLFFQVMLLGGYLYAHLAPRWIGVRRHALVHLALLLAALWTLPIGVGRGVSPPVADNPIPWLLAVLGVSLGAPFFLLSSTAPLLQRWFARTDHPLADDPYPLYAASNLGSLLALLSYPFVIEPGLRLADQSRWWAVGYGTLVCLVAASAFVMRRGERGHAAVDRATASEAFAAAPKPSAARVSAGDRVRWVLLALVPSSLVLGVTTYLTADIAAVPLLWVVPLAFYLLSFAIVFARRPIVSHASMLTWHALTVIPLVLFFVWRAAGLFELLPWHLAAFFLTAMVCHGELAATRPPVARLTEFYLWISIGGALGGVFNVLVAPILFDTVFEYPLMLVAGLAVRARSRTLVDERTRLIEVAILSAAMLGLAGAQAAMRGAVVGSPTRAIAIAAGIGLTGAIGILCYRQKRQPIQLALAALALIVLGRIGATSGGEILLTDRNFYGTRTVRESRGYHILTHGTTTHGAQNTDPARSGDPLTYYSRGGPLGDIFRSRSPRSGRSGRSIAIVGLGTGSASAYSEPNDRWTYYEIDPAMERLARNPGYFTYLRDGEPAAVVLGDGRLSLAAVQDRTYDLIALDAFSSDAIPVHLLTREALALYVEKLAPGGLIAVHLSNRYLDLEPVVAELARDAGLTAVIRNHAASDEDRLDWKFSSKWAAVGRDSASLATLASLSEWRALRRDAKGRVWTDDYSDLAGALRIRSGIGPRVKAAFFP